MSTEQNKAIVRRVYEELINQENKGIIDEVYASEVVIHDPFMGTMTGIAAFKQLFGVFDAAFPGHRVIVILYWDSAADAANGAQTFGPTWFAKNVAPYLASEQQRSVGEVILQYQK